MLNVGIDWGRKKSQYLILSEDAEIVKAGAVGPEPQALAEFLDLLVGLGSPRQGARVGIDRKDCPLVRALLAEGPTLYLINPKSSERARDLFRPAGDKDDLGDAFAHAQMVRCFHPHLQPLGGRDPLIEKLRLLLRSQRALVQSRSAFYQRLGSTLADWAPGLRRLCGDLTTEWARDLLAEFPLDRDLADVHGNTLNHFLRNHRMREETQEEIRRFAGRPQLAVPEGMAGFLRRQIRSHLELLAELDRQVEAAESRIEQLLEEAPAAQHLRSLPGAGPQTTAAFLVVFGADQGQGRSWRQHASFAGLSPVTRQSGGHRQVKRRKACDKTLRKSLVQFAFCSSQRPGCWAGPYYRRKRREGHRHYSALRCLAHRWVKIAHAICKNDTPYREGHHRRRRRRRGHKAPARERQPRAEGPNAGVCGPQIGRPAGRRRPRWPFTAESAPHFQMASQTHMMPPEANAASRTPPISPLFLT